MSFAKSAALMIVPLLIMLAPGRAAAQLSLSIYFLSDASGIAMGASGTPNASISFGTVGAYGGTVPTGVTKTVTGSTSWTLSTPFDIGVLGVGIVNPSYTLTAKLNTADAVNTWKVNSVNVSSGALMTLTTTAIYNIYTSYTLGLTIPFSEAPGTISNTLYFTATGN